jgi:hypothetical protein
MTATEIGEIWVIGGEIKNAGFLVDGIKNELLNEKTLSDPPDSAYPCLSGKEQRTTGN